MLLDTQARTRALRRIQLVMFDFDGVFTDNRVMVREDGLESVSCWRSDGVGLANLATLGVKTAIISAERNPVVAARAKKMNVVCFSGCANKKQVVEDLLRSENLAPKAAAFVGNDLPDLEPMQVVGLAIAVADAYPAVVECAHLVTVRPGGYGAVREICDWITAAHRNP